jgi:hypothetical protein
MGPEEFERYRFERLATLRRISADAAEGKPWPERFAKQIEEYDISDSEVLAAAQYLKQAVLRKIVADATRGVAWAQAHEPVLRRYNIDETEAAKYVENNISDEQKAQARKDTVRRLAYRRMLVHPLANSDLEAMTNLQISEREVEDLAQRLITSGYRKDRIMQSIVAASRRSIDWRDKYAAALQINRISDSEIATAIAADAHKQQEAVALHAARERSTMDRAKAKQIESAVKEAMSNLDDPNWVQKAQLKRHRSVDCALAFSHAFERAADSNHRAGLIHSLCVRIMAGRSVEVAPYPGLIARHSIATDEISQTVRGQLKNDCFRAALQKQPPGFDLSTKLQSALARLRPEWQARLNLDFQQVAQEFDQFRRRIWLREFTILRPTVEELQSQYSKILDECSLTIDFILSELERTQQWDLPQVLQAFSDLSGGRLRARRIQMQRLTSHKSGEPRLIQTHRKLQQSFAESWCERFPHLGEVRFSLKISDGPGFTIDKIAEADLLDEKPSRQSEMILLDALELAARDVEQKLSGEAFTPCWMGGFKVP